MTIETPLMRRLALRLPIIQAPMAGGGDTPALVAAVGEAGGLGSMGAAYLGPDALARAAADIRARSNRSFGVNLFAPQPAPAPVADPAPAVARVAAAHEELGLDPPAPPEPAADPFEAQFAALLESGAALFSVTFGLPPAWAVEAAKARGMLFAATATTVAEAVAAEAAGADAIVAQGSEAGGHRGTFAGPFEAAMVGTMALVPQMVDAVSVPVIASGGIMDGRGVAAALALGAQAVQMGTAFLTCDEAGAPDVYKDAILGAREDATRLTRAFSGRPARGVVNRFMETVEPAPDAGDILPFPLQNTLTRPMRTAAKAQGRAEFLSLWAGQGVRLARRQSAADLMARLAEETEAAIARLGN